MTTPPFEAICHQLVICNDHLYSKWKCLSSPFRKCVYHHKI